MKIKFERIVWALLAGCLLCILLAQAGRATQLDFVWKRDARSALPTAAAMENAPWVLMFPPARRAPARMYAHVAAAMGDCAGTGRGTKGIGGG